MPARAWVWVVTVMVLSLVRGRAGDWVALCHPWQAGYQGSDARGKLYATHVAVALVHHAGAEGQGQE